MQKIVLKTLSKTSKTISNLSFLFFYLLTPLFGVNIEIKNPQAFEFNNNQKDYTIKANYYINKLKAKDIVGVLFFKDEYLLAKNYYQDGNFTKKNLFLHFYKAYEFERKLYLFNIQGFMQDAKIKAKKAIYWQNYLKLIECEVKMPKKILRRKELLLKLP